MDWFSQPPPHAFKIVLKLSETRASPYQAVTNPSHRRGRCFKPLLHPWILNPTKKSPRLPDVTGLLTPLSTKLTKSLSFGSTPTRFLAPSLFSCSSILHAISFSLSPAPLLDLLVQKQSWEFSTVQWVFRIFRITVWTLHQHRLYSTLGPTSAFAK